ncbi:MAG: oligosaccharide flippase family protein, partial [Endomicrobiia bacterium]|nr:oligosaccharide flippase family protein [Endomicrobiia bacterium]
MIKSETLARNSAINIIGNITPLIFGAVAMPFIIKGLGVARFGVLSLAWGVIVYFGFFDFGIARASTKFIAEFAATGDKKNVSAMFWTSGALQLILGVLAGLFVFAAAPWVTAAAFKIPPEILGETELAFKVLALALPAALLSSGFKSVL